VSADRPFPKRNPTFAYGPCGRRSSAWGEKRNHRHVSIVPTWTNCGHARGASCTRESEQPPTCFLARHAIGDWGELEPTDVAENEYSVAHGFRLLSSYQTDAGETLWIITEADRSATTLLLPEEY
jgi:hypothetical protein